MPVWNASDKNQSKSENHSLVSEDLSHCRDGRSKEELCSQPREAQLDRTNPNARFQEPYLFPPQKIIKTSKFKLSTAAGFQIRRKDSATSPRILIPRLLSPLRGTLGQVVMDLGEMGSTIPRLGQEQARLSMLPLATEWPRGSAARHWSLGSERAPHPVCSRSPAQCKERCVAVSPKLHHKLQNQPIL